MSFSIIFDEIRPSKVHKNGVIFSVVDVIGVAKSVADCATITSSKTGKEYKKRDLVIVDKSLVEVGLTLWGTNAETFEAEGNPVVAVKGKFFSKVKIFLMILTTFEFSAKN